MSESSVLQQQIKLLVARTLEVSQDQLDGSTPLLSGEMGLDSFSALRLLTAVEEEFGVHIDDDSFHVLETISALVDFVQSNGAGD